MQDKLTEAMMHIRFWLGRALIHAGLRVMPQGRVKAELYSLFDQWATHVRATVKPQIITDPPTGTSFRLAGCDKEPKP